MKRLVLSNSLKITRFLSKFHDTHPIAQKISKSHILLIIKVLSILVFVLLYKPTTAQTDSDEELFEKAKSLLYSEPDESITIARELPYYFSEFERCSSGIKTFCSFNLHRLKVT